MKQLATLYPQWGAECNEWAPTHQCSGCVPHPQAIQEALPREWCYRQVAGVKFSPQTKLHEPSWRPPFQIILYCVKLTIKTDYHILRSFVRLFLLLIIVSGIWIVQSARWSQEAVKSRQGTHSYWARGHWDSELDNARHGDTATISDRARLACSWETINDFRSMTSPNTCSSITSD